MLELLSMIPTAAYILFGIGVVLAVIEMFMPGFGVAGIVAFICFAVSIALAARDLTQGIVFTLIVLAVVIILLILFFVMLSRGRVMPKLILKSNNTADLGFSGTSDYSFLADSEGRAETALRPAGRASIGGRTYDVVSDGEFIEKGAQIRVMQVSGNRIVVNKTAEAVLN